jgi:hypothetical protein
MPSVDSKKEPNGRKESNLSVATGVVGEMFGSSEPSEGKLRRLVAGALFGESSAFMLAMLSVPHFDAPLTIALVAFAIAMPCLAADFYVLSSPPAAPHSPLGHIATQARDVTLWGVAETIGIIAALVGNITFVWHLSSIALIAGLGAFMFVVIAFYVVMVIIILRVAGRTSGATNTLEAGE